jgi:SH3/ankyrin repeat-containing protein
LFSK